MAPLDVTFILDQAIDRLRAGEPLDRILAAYPLAADELRPVLTLSAELADLPLLEPEPHLATRHFNAMMAAFEEEEEKEKRPSGVTLWSWLSGHLIFHPSRPVTPMWPRLARALALVMLAVVISGGWVVSAAADTVPGDPLYPVKRTVERSRLSLVRDSVARDRLVDQFNAERLSEIDTLQELGRAAEVEFTASFDRQERDVWLFDQAAVQITDQTIVVGSIVADQPAAIRARLNADGTLTAVEIRGPQVDSPTIVPVATATPTRRPTRQPTHSVPTATPRPTRTPREHPTREATATREREATPTRTKDDQLTRDHRPTTTHAPTERPKATATRDNRPTPTIQPPPTDAPTRDKPPTAEPTLPPVNVVPTAKPTSEPHPTEKPTARPNDHPPTATPTPHRGDRDGDRHPP